MRLTFPTLSFDGEVVGITSDSRQAKAGWIFVAVPGTTVDGHEFVDQVAAQKPALIIGERSASEFVLDGVRYIQVSNSREMLALLAAEFHGNPTRAMLTIGVTGTSGKTTTTYLIEAILAAAGHKVGVIGTVNFRFAGEVIPSTHTTPGPVELQKILADMRSRGCTAVVMEVSSHALKQWRTGGIAFDGLVFTNLTPEHLDYHPDMEDYYGAKAMLFTTYVEAAQAAGKKPVAAVCVDDEYGQRLTQESKAATRTYGFAPDLDYSGAHTTYDLNGIHGQVGKVSFRSPLTGRFNVSNLLGAIAISEQLGIASTAIERGLAGLALVPGRLERVPNAHGFTVLIDYAHKPDALEKVLKTLREVQGLKRLITVFGCGGDRDRGKRPVMGRLAVELSERVFVTSDNPRTESPSAIAAEITAGMKGHSNFTIELDRKKAIFAAIAEAKPGDIVCIAGKGHEDYQIVGDPGHPGGTRKIHFDDVEVATEALSKYLT